MKFFIKKLITLIITLLVISFLTFTAFSVIPGDAALSRLGKDATEEQLERARDEMGLNDPLLERYGRWVTDAMQGDFGESYRYEGTSVRSLLAQRLPVTVLLAVISLLIITVISVPLGILSARFAGKWVDTLTNCLTQILMAVPSFFLGMILTYVFGLILHMFQPGKFIEPSENFGKSAQYLLFPALAVALPKIAMVVKFLRSSILTEMNREYVRTAYSRGNTETAACAEKCDDSGCDVLCDGNRGDPCRQHRGGAGVQRAGNRKTSDQLDLQPRLSGCAGDRAVYHIGGRTYQFCG